MNALWKCVYVSWPSVAVMHFSNQHFSSQRWKSSQRSRVSQRSREDRSCVVCGAFLVIAYVVILAPCRKHPVGSGHLHLLLTFGRLNVGELTLTPSTTLPSVRATVSKHRKQSFDGGARLILSSCCRDLSQDELNCTDANY